MNVSREEIAIRLFDKARAIADFKTSSRRLKIWQNVTDPDQPALFMVKGNEVVEQRGRGLPAVHLLNFQFFIYSTVGNDDRALTSTPINEILDAFEDAFTPAEGATDHVETLGGICSHAWIEGEIEVFEGMLEGQAIAIVPINVLVP